ncbi:unnamed protein product [Rhizoctonia solani]|uniref:CHAT domain-containing protein n=1 Tax=Rhizoctonia solani TaxID=456999 RepID=A0A8H3H8W3_9AGAM|nr:unnamed protein product [Rhizoctonia solani]
MFGAARATGADGPQPRVLTASATLDWESLNGESSEEEVPEVVEPSHAEIKMALFGLMGRPYEFQDFDESHLILARMLSITPDGDPGAALIYEIFDNLCGSHAQRAQDADNHIYSGPITIQTKDDPVRLYYFGIAHRGQYILEGKLDNLERSIGCLTKVVELTEETDPELPKYLIGLGDSLFGRFERFSEVEFLEDAIKHQRRACSMLQHPEPYFLIDLGNSLVQRFRVLGDGADLEEAIELQEQAVASVTTNPDKTDLELCYNSLAISLVFRFEYASNPVDLDKAFELLELALRLDLEPKIFASTINNMGIALQKQYLHFVEIGIIDQAIVYQKQAVELTTDSNPDKPGYLTNLASSLQHKFEHLGDMGDLERAISHQLGALNLLPKKHNFRPSILNDLGKSYRQRFGSTGKATDIGQSINYLLEALDLTPVNSPNRLMWLLNLGHSFREKFESEGQLADVDRAINYHYEAATKSPKDHMDKADRLDQLGSAYMSRFERLQELADLDYAIDQYRAARSIYGSGNRKASATLNNLGAALCRKFDYVGRLSDIDESISILREAIKICSKKAYMSTLQYSLGVSLASRYRRANQIQDIDESVTCLEQAVSLETDNHPDMPLLLHHLCASLYLRCNRTNNPEEIDKTVEYQIKALDLTPEGHLHRPAMLNVLGDTLAWRYSARKEPKGTDWDDAINAYKRAALSIIGMPYVRFEAAFSWAEMASLRRESPLEAYKIAFSIIPQLVWMGTTIDQRYKGIDYISRLTTQAVSYAIAEGAYSLALEWFEEGRSIVWRQMLGLRTPMDKLRAADQSLADRLEKVAQALDQAGSAKPTRLRSGATVNSLEKAAQSHHRLAEEWDQLLDKVRQLDDFSDFLRPKKANHLLQAARDGAIVAINVHETRCDALVIQIDRAHLDCIPLPGLSHQKALDAQKQLLTLLSLAGVRYREAKPVVSPKTGGAFKKFEGIRKPFSQMAHRASKIFAAPEEASSSRSSSSASWFSLGRTARRPFMEEDEDDSSADELGNILELLWVDVVHPILDYLKYLNPKPGAELPHITWCVTGPLTFLPLHAAGIYKAPNPKNKVFNCAVSSYTPTLNGLLVPSSSTDDFSGILTIGQASTPGLSALPGTEKELDSIARLANSLRLTKLIDHAATPNTVLEAINTHSWVHFACHASQVPQDPTSSAFYLHKGTLDLNTITQQSLGQKAFAFLSACQTATGDLDLPEEAVHLAAGMIMAGYPTVIATMWSIGDSDAPLIAEHTYAEMLAGGIPDSTKASRALHRAVGVLRRKVGESAFVSWVPYIHLGI